MVKFKNDRNISDREWDIYWNGTTEQWEEIREEVQREIEKQTSQRNFHERDRHNPSKCL